jgi:two-component system, OmpR family, sensor histidine kinase KdpD
VNVRRPLAGLLAGAALIALVSGAIYLLRDHVPVLAVRQVAAERGSTYIFVGTPDESRRREIFGGSLLSRMVRELPGLDIRVVADRAQRETEPR